MTKWTQTVSSDGMAIELNGQMVLGGIKGAVVPPGGPGQTLQPGKMTVAGVPFGRDLFVSTVPAEKDDDVLILRATYCGGPVDGQGGVQLRIGDWPEFDKAQVSYRHSRYWTRPAWLNAPGEMPDKTQFLLVRRSARKGKYLLILPLTYGGMRAELRTEEGQATLVSLSGDSRFTPCGFLMAAIAVGDDPYELVNRVFAAAMNELGSGRLRKDKSVPEFVHDFGWCSWNAFYDKVTEEKVIAALDTFAAGKMPVGFYILDDGWQLGGSYTASKPDGATHMPWGLKSFKANTDKFPSGLAGLIRRIKSATTLRHFGVWHTLQGIWGGLHPDGELFSQYETYTDVWGHIIFKPSESYRFFQDYHAYVRSCGADFVKVDNQSTLEGNVEERYPVGEAARTVHQAMDGSVAVHFSGQVINCMCMSSDIMLQLPYSNVARNSDDFYPWRPNNPGDHVSQNAYNNLWTGQLAIPDWDMFESHHPYGRFHAMARAISGSPIYCTDYPGKQDFQLLRRLVLSDGRALRCEEPAQVTRDCLFVDPVNDAVLMKLFNTLPTGHGLLGVFNCRITPGMPEEKKGQEKKEYTVFTPEQRAALAASVKYSPADVEGLADGSYAVFSHRTGELSVMTRRQKAAMTLVKYDCDLLVLAPIEQNLAVLGLVDKFNSPAAIETWGVEGKTLLAQFVDGGLAGFYAARKPRQVQINDKPARKFDYDKATGLLTVKLPLGKPAVVTVTM